MFSCLASASRIGGLWLTCSSDKTPPAQMAQGQSSATISSTCTECKTLPRPKHMPKVASKTEKQNRNKLCKMGDFCTLFVFFLYFWFQERHLEVQMDLWRGPQELKRPAICKREAERCSKIWFEARLASYIGKN